ncbi:MAG: GAF domain-containing protein [Desulfovibrio sp.]|nr:GAF domain-containing protein [Desulfovibrio sp.]
MTIDIVEKHVLSIVCSVFDAYTAVLVLPGENEEEYRLSGYFSLGDKVVPNARISAGSLAGWIIRNRQPLLVPNFDQHQSNLGYYTGSEEENIKAFMGCPVPMGGALCVDSKRQYSFSNKDHKILHLFAELVSRQQGQQPVGNIPRYFAEMSVIQEMRFQYKRWPLFLQNFLRTMADATGFDYCAFASLAIPGKTYCIEAESNRVLLHDQPLVLPIGTGIAGWVFCNEQPVEAVGTEGTSVSALFGKQPDMPDFQVTVCMPIMVNKSTKGALCLANTSSLHIDEGLRSFIHQAVDHLSLFLENLYLKTRLRTMLPKAQIHREGQRAHATLLSPGKEI